MRYIDLHTHTNNSDGTDSVRQLIDNAIKRKLAAVAKTDHNTLKGNGEFIRYAKGKPIRAIPGVEISTRDGKNRVHVVGLNVNHTPELDSMLQRLRDYGRVRADFTMRRLREAGYPVMREDVERFSGSDNINRGNIAGYMLAAGMIKDRDSLFRDVLSRPGFNMPEWAVTPRDAVRVIRAAGGKAVWAHPLEGRGKRPQREIPYMEGIIDRAGGFDAIEAQHTTHTKGQRALVEQLAAERGIPLSGGSDYHGANKPGVKLGEGLDNVHVPEVALEEIGI